jgi:hypothetical protein
MKCKTCGGPAIALFYSLFCEACDDRTKVRVDVHRGFIVFRARPAGSTEYVFRTEQDAERWRTAAGLGRFPIRRVTACAALEWMHRSGLELDVANGMFEVHPRDAVAPAAHRVFLDPE